MVLLPSRYIDKQLHHWYGPWLLRRILLISAVVQDLNIMFTASRPALKLLAAVVWYVGSAVLLLKGCSLLLEASAIQPGLIWPILVILTALFLGSVKARFLFSKSCRKNLARIDALEQPKLWQFFRPGFFGALALMILTGAALSRLADGRYWPLLMVALLDLAIGIALLASSIVFWQTKPTIHSMTAPVKQQKKSSGNL